MIGMTLIPPSKKKGTAQTAKQAATNQQVQQQITQIITSGVTKEQLAAADGAGMVGVLPQYTYTDGSGMPVAVAYEEGDESNKTTVDKAIDDLYGVAKSNEAALPGKQDKLVDSDSVTVDGNKVTVAAITPAVIENYCTNFFN